MTGGWLAGAAAELELLLRATLLIGAAWAAAATLRKAGASAAARHMAWLFGIAALLALPLLWWLAPALRLPILLPEAAAALSPASAAASPAPGLAGSTAAALPGSKTLLLIAYALGAALLLLRFAIVQHMLSRLWRDADPVRDPAWLDLLSRLSCEMRLSRRVELRIARGPAMPMTWGTLAPKVLLPAEADAWPPERRRLVLLHELAHVARRDSLARSAASLACALYWFHPGAWLAARRLRLEQERAADDRVLTAGAPARAYALSLLDLARRVEESPRREFAPAMAGMRELERRLVSITTPARRDRPGPAFLYASALASACVTLVVAAGVPVGPSLALPDPLRVEPTPFASLPAKSVDPAPAEVRSESEARRPMRARGEGPSGNVGSRRERAGADAPMLHAVGPPLETGGRLDEPPAPSLSIDVRVIDRGRQAVPAYSRRIADYGPQLPRRDIVEPDADARIPWEARQEDRADTGNGGNTARGLGIRLAPANASFGSPEGATPPRPRLTLSIGPNSP